MKKFSYENPLTSVFQHEYALLHCLFALFYDVECSDFLVETLYLYYMELSKTHKNGMTSFGKQEVLMRKIKYWIQRDFLGKIKFPMMDKCRVIMTATIKEDGSHLFAFTDGIYSFCVSLEREGGLVTGISLDA